MILYLGTKGVYNDLIHDPLNNEMNEQILGKKHTPISHLKNRKQALEREKHTQISKLGEHACM